MPIFVVEADLDLRTLFAEVLNFAGYEVQFREAYGLEVEELAA